MGAVLVYDYENQSLIMRTCSAHCWAAEAHLSGPAPR